MTKKIEKDYHDLAKEKGLKWVGLELPLNVVAKTAWECGNNHKFKSTYNKVQQGRGCPYCSNHIKLIEENYYNLAKRRGLYWLGPFPKSTHVNTLWKCSKGHKFTSTYNRIQCGGGCPYCSNHVKLVGSNYYRLAILHGFKWVGKNLPKSVKTKTQWECSEGHRWLARYNDIKQGYGCPYCAGNAKKIKEDYYRLAENRKFSWISSELPKNTNIKTLWMCREKHKWLATYDNIRRGNGCPYCANRVKKIEKDYNKLANSFNFLWVGKTLPKTTHYKTLWECRKRHLWEATYHNIRGGSGCPHCKNIVSGQRVSKPQIKLNNLLYGILNYPEERYRIDIAIMRNSQKIAVEYDCQYWHRGKEEHDAKRDKFLISCGWKVLHVKKVMVKA